MITAIPRSGNSASKAYVYNRASSLLVTHWVRSGKVRNYTLSMRTLLSAVTLFRQNKRSKRGQGMKLSLETEPQAHATISFSDQIDLVT